MITITVSVFLLLLLDTVTDSCGSYMLLLTGIVNRHMLTGKVTCWILILILTSTVNC